MSGLPLVQKCLFVQQHLDDADSKMQVWLDMALNTAKNMNTSIPDLFIKCFHDYPAVENLSAFIFHSSMKGLRDVLHEVNSQ